MCGGEKARKKAEPEAEADTRKEEQRQARRRAEEERALQKAEDEAQRKEARRLHEEEKARKKGEAAAEAETRKEEQRQARRREEDERARQKAEDEGKRKEGRRLEEEEKAREKAEADAQRIAARRQEEEERAKRKAAAERQEEEARAQKKAEADARKEEQRQKVAEARAELTRQREEARQTRKEETAARARAKEETAAARKAEREANEQARAEAQAAGKKAPGEGEATDGEVDDTPLHPLTIEDLCGAAAPLGASQHVYLITFSALVADAPSAADAPLSAGGAAVGADAGDSVAATEEAPGAHEAEEASEQEAARDPATLTREEVRDAVLHAVDNPAFRQGGRRPIRKLYAEKLVVFREEHRDGRLHYHVALKLPWQVAWEPLKGALRQHSRLCSHWAETHKKWWSALRYGVFTTPKKPVVDSAPLTYAADGRPVHLYEECQEPFSAAGTKRRREAQEVAAAGKGAKAPRFTSYDFKCLVLARELKTPEAVLTYMEQYGSRGFRDYVSPNQSRLPQLLNEAEEMAAAPERHRLAEETEWELIERTAATGSCTCPGAGCEWDAAATAFFTRSQRTIEEDRLWAALRNVIVNGPQRSSRAVMIMGESQTGKSTVVVPVDPVFGSQNVVHKPAPGISNGKPDPNVSRWALRNWAKKNKRFFYLDDIRPVELAAQGVIPLTTWLAALDRKYFEVNAAQGFNDGNIDVLITKGFVVTAKKKELWDPIHPLTREDITHLKNRFEIFEARAAPDGFTYFRAYLLSCPLTPLLPSCLPQRRRYLLK